LHDGSGAERKPSSPATAPARPRLLHATTPRHGVSTAGVPSHPTCSSTWFIHQERLPQEASSAERLPEAIRKLKDGQGQYLWQAGIKEGQPDTLLN
jgi:hypothetical protein